MRSARTLPVLTSSTNSLAAEMALAVMTSLIRRTGPRVVNLHLKVTLPSAAVETAIVPASPPEEHVSPFRSSIEPSEERDVPDTPACPWANVVPAAAAATSAAMPMRR